MATEKNDIENNENKIKYIEVLEKFRDGEFVDFSDFLEKKSLEEVMTIANKVVVQLIVKKEQITDEVLYEIEKQKSMFFFGLLQCTSLEIDEKDKTSKNYDIDFENLAYENSATIRKLYKIIDNVSLRLDLKIIDSLKEALSNVPNTKQIKELEQGLDNIFSKRSSGDLKMIENILEYNDPNLKLIKNIIMTPNENKKEELKKSGDNITKR